MHITCIKNCAILYHDNDVLQKLSQGIKNVIIIHHLPKSSIILYYHNRSCSICFTHFSCELRWCLGYNGDLCNYNGLRVWLWHVITPSRQHVV